MIFFSKICLFAFVLSLKTSNAPVMRTKWACKGRNVVECILPFASVQEPHTSPRRGGCSDFLQPPLCLTASESQAPPVRGGRSPWGEIGGGVHGSCKNLVCLNPIFGFYHSMIKLFIKKVFYDGKVHLFFSLLEVTKDSVLRHQLRIQNKINKKP